MVQSKLAQDVYRAAEYCVTPDRHIKGGGHLWLHPNGVYYVLYGPRLKQRVSARTTDRETAQRFLERFCR